MIYFIVKIMAYSNEGGYPRADQTSEERAKIAASVRKISEVVPAAGDLIGFFDTRNPRYNIFPVPYFVNKSDDPNEPPFIAVSGYDPQTRILAPFWIVDGERIVYNTRKMNNPDQTMNNRSLEEYIANG